MLEPTKGEIIGKEHVYPIRVFYEDTDAGGVVYYANYLRFAERARSEFLRFLSTSWAGDMSDIDLVFMVKHCEIEYKAPAKLDEAIEMHTTLKEMGGAWLLMEQKVVRNSQELVVINIKLATVSLNSGRPSRIPAGLKEKMAEFISN